MTKINNLSTSHSHASLRTTASNNSLRNRDANVEPRSTSGLPITFSGPLTAESSASLIRDPEMLQMLREQQAKMERITSEHRQRFNDSLKSDSIASWTCTSCFDPVFAYNCPFEEDKPEEPPHRAPEFYSDPFIQFINENPTVFHTVGHFEKKLVEKGFLKLSEREDWTTVLEVGGKYFVSRNASSLVAFIVGEQYQPGISGVAMIAGHIDALSARLKPISKKPNVEGYKMLGVAPYAGGINTTWLDRDLGIGGKVIVKGKNGEVVSKLVKLDWPIARIPTLAPHFGTPALGPFNKETQMVPVVGLDSSEICGEEEEKFREKIRKDTFAATQPEKLVYLIAKALGVSDPSAIINWELELFDTQPATLGGLSKEFIFSPRIDDKLCSWAALYALLEASESKKVTSNSTISLAAFFDDEEIGSRLRQGAMGNFLPGTIERIVDAFSNTHSPNLIQQTYANSFLISADVIHAVNPNFTSAYLPDHMPRLNMGLVVSADPNGHMTTDSVSTAFLELVAQRTEPRHKLQVFQIRNDSRSGGTVGPMLSGRMGVRAIDAGLAQLSMHSIRATTGSKEPGLGVQIFRGFYEHFEEVDEVMTGC